MLDKGHGKYPDAEDELTEDSGGFNRRRMMGYLVAGPTLAVGAGALTPADAKAAGIPTVQAVDAYDLSDALRDSARATHYNVALTMNTDGTADFALNRSDNGQGILTVFAMIVAEELELPLEKVNVTLRDADPALLYNQLTGGSNTVFSLLEPVRLVCGLAKQQMMGAAAKQMGVDVSALSVANGIVSGAGKSLSYGDLASAAAVSKTKKIDVKLKPRSAFRLLGTEVGRLDARDAVTGKKQFVMDLKIPDALPTMICRAPTHNAPIKALLNEAEIRKMPGVTDVGIVQHDTQWPGGVAIRAKTFGQCIDAVRAVKAEWGAGPVDGLSDKSMIDQVTAGMLPMTPALPGEVVEETFVFHSRPGDPLETNGAIADVRGDGATIWAAAKNPIWGQQEVARILGFSEGQVKFHVIQGGGSFGRKLFNDAAFEAAICSKMWGKPVKLFWHRADGPRQGRHKAASVSKVRLVRSGDNVLTADQTHASIPNDLSHGLGEAATADAAELPPGVAGFSQTVFATTAVVPYNFGVANQLLSEVFSIAQFKTSSVRNVYSPDVRTAQELTVDKMAAAMGKDPMDFRIEYARDARMKDVLVKAKELSGWGRALPAGVVQGVAIAREYKAYIATVVELDMRPATVNRKVYRGVAGPRVTKATVVVDPSMALNPLGFKAMMMGGTMDGIAQALTYSLHMENGRFLEGSWDHSHYTRQQNAPLDFVCEIINSGKGEPGGAGELACAPGMAATACAYGRGTGQTPTVFPINFGTLGFKPFPATPPIPKSPTNGFARAKRERAYQRKHK